MKKQDEKKQVLMMRIFVIVFVVISVVIALNKDSIPNIAQLMGYSWGALAGAFTMLVSLVLVPIVSLITPKMEEKRTDELFACFDEKVEVAVKKVLD